MTFSHSRKGHCFRSILTKPVETNDRKLESLFGLEGTREHGMDQTPAPFAMRLPATARSRDGWKNPTAS